MNPAVPPGPTRAPGDESPGVPGLSNWRRVYVFVAATFILWAALLAWLSRAFS